MAVPAPKAKRIKTKEEIAKIAKGNIPEFEFFTEDGSAVVLYLHNRNGRVYIPGSLHEAFFDVCSEHGETLKAAKLDSLNVPLLLSIEQAADDVPLASDPEPVEGEEVEAVLYKTAEEKRNEIFVNNQAAVLEEIQRLASISMLGGLEPYAKLQSSRIDRDFYYKALRVILDVDDPDIPEQYHEEIRADWNSDSYMSQNFEEVKTIVELFRTRVGF